MEVRLVALGFDARGERELVEQLGELTGSGFDHLDVPLLRLLEVAHPHERLREAVDRRERCAEIVGRERDEPRERCFL